MRPNPEQQKVIDSLGASMNVCAGAGTGKTATLTECIVRCVLDEMRSHPNEEHPIRSVLAITFTRAAASELKDRVRRAFLEIAASPDCEEPEAYESLARECGEAWITTIHQMASRILRENAVEFGIDPTFQVLGEDEEDAITLEAMNRALSEIGLESAGVWTSRLLRLAHSQDGSNPLFQAIRKLQSRMSVVGDDALVKRHSSDAHPAKLLERLKGEALRMSEVLDPVYWGGKPTDTAVKMVQGFEDALFGLDDFLAEHGSSLSFSSDAFPVDEFFEIIAAFPKPSKSFGGAKRVEVAEARDAYRQSLGEVARDAMNAVRSEMLDALLAFAELTMRYESMLKSQGSPRLGQSDLLKMAEQKLGDPRYAHIRDRYRSMFKCIFVDEFQDTDALQFRLIGLLAKDEQLKDGHGHASTHANVCTVGDMQQSIYRFRGADVQQSIQRRDSLEGSGYEALPLTSNYRSHEDILSVVDLAFSRPDAFGSDFLRLAAKRMDGQGFEQPDGAPRVTFDFLSASRAANGVAGIPVDIATKLGARKIASHFKELVDSGVSPGRCCLLLGGMPKASIYVEAFEQAGIPCMITGGSTYCETSEARLVRDLLDFSSLPQNEDAIIRILLSPLFNISDDDLLRYAHPDGTSTRRPISASSRGSQESSVGESSVALAISRLARFREDAAHSASKAIRSLALDTGLLARLSAVDSLEMLARAANLEKAIRLVADMESLSSGAASLSSRYRAMLEHSKEAPGILARQSGDFVKVMSIHASKGLEFDHVAVSAIRRGDSAREDIVAENIGGDTYVTFLNALKGSSKSLTDRMRGFEELSAGEEGLSGDMRTISDADDPTFNHALAEYAQAQEMAEAQRLLYVAMTRARETLYVQCVASQPSDFGKGTYSLLLEAACERLGLDASDIPDRLSQHDDLLRLEARKLTAETFDESELEHEQQPSEKSAGFLVPVYEEVQPLEFEPHDPFREHLRSYTSLSRSPGETLDEIEGLGFPADSDSPESIEDAQGARAGKAQGANAFPMDGNASELGVAFHRLAQISLLETADSATRNPVYPTDAQIESHSRTLTESQRARLKAALGNLLESDLYQTFVHHELLAAEVPFAVPVGNGDMAFTLEGEIDALASDADGKVAHVIDYKTGEADHVASNDLEESHLLQAQCYSYGLLKNGFDKVQIRFAIVEHVDPKSGEPVHVDYEFSESDVRDLEESIQKHALAT